MKEVISIIGPTAVGKTSLCLELAKKLPIEVISADSRQIYSEMDIGTDKPLPSALKRVPHHLINIKSPDEIYSAYEFITDCKRKVNEIRKRENIPIICGGTIFYIKSLLEGMFEEPEIRDEIRNSVRREIEKRGAPEVHKDLEKFDSQSAERIHPNDKQRIARAVEVYRASGVTLSEFWERSNKNSIPLDLYALLLPKQKLKKRIKKRVEKMFDRGFVEEIKGLLEKGYKPSLYSFTSIGYKEVSEYILNKNGSSLKETRTKIIKETKKYMDKQITFIKGLPEVKIFSNKEDLKSEIISTVKSDGSHSSTN